MKKRNEYEQGIYSQFFKNGEKGTWLVLLIVFFTTLRFLRFENFEKKIAKSILFF